MNKDEALEQIKRFEEKYKDEVDEVVPLVVRRSYHKDDPDEVKVVETRILPRVNAENIVKSNKTALDYVNKQFSSMKKRRKEMMKQVLNELKGTIKRINAEYKEIRSLNDDEYKNLAVKKLDDYVERLEKRISGEDAAKKELKERVNKIFEEEKLGLEDKRRRVEFELSIYNNVV